MSVESDEIARRVAHYLESAGRDGRLTLLGKTGRVFDVMVPSYWKESVAVTLEVRDRSLHAEAFFMRAPEDNPGPAYQLLLRRNLESRLWRFGSNDSGDVSLVADLPLESLEEQRLDELLGALVTLTDDTYRPYFKRAFETALRQQVARGGPGLDQPPPWARDYERPPP